MKQLHVYFSGRVQGVGFRYRSCVTARQCKVTGWVKNLADGRVELLAEGEEAELVEYLKRLCDQMQHYINDTSVSWGIASHQFVGFEIAH